MKKLTYSRAIKEAFVEEMERDESVFLIGEDVQFGFLQITTGLVQQFGTDRVIDTPISEHAITGAVIGSAMAGFRPIQEANFSDFIMVAYAELFMNAAKWRFKNAGKVKLPMVLFAAVGGGLKLGCEDSSTPTGYFMHTPGLKVVFPSNPYDAKGLLKSAIRDDNPVVYFYHKTLLGMTEEIPEDDYVVELGKAAVKRQGSDVTVVALGNMVNLSLKVADELQGELSVEVIDLRTLVPLDMETIVASVKKTGRLLVVDEDVEVCGITAEISMQVIEEAFDYFDAPPKRVAAANIPIPGGVLEQYALPQPETIKAAIKSFF